MNYVKKPIPVRAVQWNGPEDNEKCEPAFITTCPNGYEIATYEGWLKLIPGSYVVGPGAKGEYWPVEREIFEKTYVSYADAFKFDRDEADLLTLAVANFFYARYNVVPMDDVDYETLNKIVTKFSSGVYRNT